MEGLGDAMGESGAAAHRAFCTAMRHWCRARAFVLEVDCNLVLSSASPFVGVMLGISSTLMLVIVALALSTLTAHPWLSLDTPSGFESAFGLAAGSAWAFSSVYLAAMGLLRIHMETKTTIARLEALSLEATDSAELWGHDRATHAAKLVQEFGRAVERDSKTPIVLGIKVNPNLINAIRGTVITAATSVVIKGMASWFAH
jgi:hypothetical protein